MRFVTPGRAAGAVFSLVVVALVVLYLIPSNGYYVFTPDRAHALAPLVTVPGRHPRSNQGGFYFVDVRFRKARLLEEYLGRPLASGSSLVKAQDVLGTGISEEQQRRIDLIQMAQSQKIAAALALNRLGYHVRVRLPAIVIQAVEPQAPAHRLLRSGDQILAVDGVAVHSFGTLHALVSALRPGQLLRIRYRRGGRVETASVRTIPDPANKQTAIVGILVEEKGGSIGRLPVKVKIDTAGVGGPSAGLAFALDLMEQFGRNVDRGYKVAATGELGFDGSVLPIGAIEQKTIGAREAGVDVFLVPAGDNAREARRYANGLRIIPVQSFPQALHALATLPPKAASHA
ncbi:MAG TPA: PDZ domain-containing protein [Gaiellaceae bacterium]